MSRCHTWSVLMALAVGASTVVVAADDLPEPSLDRGVGDRVANFTLTDAVSGRAVSLYDFAGKKGAVLVFLGTECPIGNLYMPRLRELADEYQSQGVVFLGINADSQDTLEKVADHAREYGLNFPVLKDTGNRVADQLAVQRTCETLLLDGRARLIYRGAIDDQFRFGVSKPKAEVSYLAESLDSLLAGQKVATTGTTVHGCPIQREAFERPPYQTLPRITAPSAEILAAFDEVHGAELPDVGEVTYSGQVADIIQRKCQNCHRPGQVGPFSLLTHKDAARWATSIWEVVDDRRMPPWHADPRHGTFENDRSLSPLERATLIAWVEQGSPIGDEAAIPPNPEYTEGWNLGEPDIVFEIPAPFLVPETGTIDYQRFVVETGFEEDVWIQAAEARPENRDVVHHIIVYVLGGEGSRSREHLCGYAPGDMPTIMPPGVGKMIPAGARLLFEIHYTPTGKSGYDRSKVGFYVAKEPIRQRAVTMGIANGKFEIPPGSDNHAVRSSHRFRQDVMLLAFMPHMHIRGKAFTYTATYPDGEEEVLLSVPAFDFNWQSYYRLAEPKLLPAGTVIDCVARYNNSSSNPALTASQVKDAVRWGDQTWEEMMIGYVDVIPIETNEEVETQAGAEAARPAASSPAPSPLGRAARLLLRAAASQSR